MSCFKIIIIFTKILLIISYSKAIAKEPNEVVVAKVNNHIITAQDVLNATNRLPKTINFSFEILLSNELRDLFH